MPSSLVTRMRKSPDLVFALAMRRNDLQPAHVRLERLGNGDGTVLLLVVLHDRDERAPDGKAGAVQRVDEARVLFAFRPVARIHAPRLEVAADRAGGNFAIGLLPRQPDLDVVGL